MLHSFGSRASDWGNLSENLRLKNFNVLDLSNANISSLVGLENLDLSNITIINLMQNSLENEDVIVLNSMAESLPKLQYVNFNLNNLQILGLNSTIRGNTKYIFGFQNYTGNLNQTEYYFSSDAQTNIQPRRATTNIT